jgi:hypothetical protein
MRPVRVVLAAAAAGLACTGVGSAATTPLRVVVSLDRSAALFGDPVTTEVEIDYDAKTIDPADIHVEPSFIPYVATSPPVVRRLGAGRIAYRYSLLCLAEACLPNSRPRLVRLPTVAVTARDGATTVHALATWPPIRITSRLTASDLAGPVRFRSASTPPAPAYRFAPGTLAGGLIIAAAICALAALALVGKEIAWLSRRSREHRLSALELAVAYVRDSTRRSDPDRRRALSLLAEAADDREPVLSAAAADTAWSESPPTPAGAAALADRAAGVEGGDG